MQIPVRNVDRQDSVRPQMAKVELKGLDGQQVDGNGVARESIHRQEIKMLWRPAFQRQTRVAQFNSNVRFRISQKTEVLPCELHNQGVDVVESVVVPRPAVCRDGTDAEADDADAQGAARTQGAQRHADSGIPGVVGGRLIPPRRSQKLQSMADGSVGESAEAKIIVFRWGVAFEQNDVRRVFIALSQNAIEIS